MRSFKILIVVAIIACNNSQNNPTIKDSSFAKGTYGYDAVFLKKYAGKIIELKQDDATVFLSADYQGRVFTSTANGDSGISFGWINYNLLSSAQKKKQFNPVGGEERFWIGPEGGQYSIYFPKGDSFNIKYWQVPAIIDTVKYALQQSDSTSATFTATAAINNYSGTLFNIAITRKIKILNNDSIAAALNTSIPNGIKAVAYKTINQLKNIGNTAWKKDSGLLSIWLLGQFTPTEQTKVIIPFSPIQNAKSYITDDYFGKIDSSRLLVKDSVLYFRCDGKSRGKLGLKPVIAKPFVCSYDFNKNVLTIIIPEVHKNAMYVNSKWELQKEPYNGDVINSYNDGPLADGSQLGPFYEIESSSPVYELKPGESEEYHQTTLHLQGDYDSLKVLLQKLININLDDVKNW